MGWPVEFSKHATPQALVLVPNEDARVQDLGGYLSGQQMLSDILPQSALICLATGTSPLVEDDGTVFFAFEGNNNHASNLERYFEKCLCAAGRLAHRHPSIAYGRARAEDLTVVASYDLDRMVFSEILNAELLEAWSGETVDSFMPPRISTPCSDLDKIAPYLALPMRHVWSDYYKSAVWKMQDGSIIAKEDDDPITVYSIEDAELLAVVERCGLDAQSVTSIYGSHHSGTLPGNDM